ncbi:hypothetical protein ACQP1K_01440 [Sphaerimonospora sp. CA-214678]|uniref:hypothetical protein n=1 Tax=Sphaerimonospora sp. CA-214678 TaxID=3240029 RepID=UPI003D92B60D
MIFRSRLSGTGQFGCHEYGTSSRDTFAICAENSGGSAEADGVGADDGLGDGFDDGLADGLDRGFGDVVKVAADDAVVDDAVMAGTPDTASPAGPPVFPPGFPAVQAVTPTMVIANIADLGFRKRAISAGYLRPAPVRRRPTPRPPPPAPHGRDLAVSRSRPP